MTPEWREKARNASKRIRSRMWKRDRSVNYLVVEAIMEYLNREERKG